MRANKKFISEVEDHLAKISDDRGLSYLRGLLTVPGNVATTRVIQSMWDELKTATAPISLPPSKKSEGPILDRVATEEIKPVRHRTAKRTI